MYTRHHLTHLCYGVFSPVESARCICEPVRFGRMAERMEEPAPLDRRECDLQAV